ncbi:MAG: hypothetical protein N2319_07320 [Candidatus Kapabacteria bacterium]|nr:hypothetical protein [Candidatus Kapabacteria bacterium]
MKNLLFFLFILLNSLLLNASILDDFQLRRISTNYKGVVFNDKSVLVYGESGVITGTTDIGKNWFRTQLNENYDINSMITLDNSYIGVLSENYIVVSNDNGLSFSYKEIGNQLKLYKILFYDNKLYILSDSKIIILNKSFETISEINIEIKSDKPDFIILNNNIYFSKNKGIIGKINLKNYQSSELNLNNSGICTDCPYPTSFVVYANKLFFLLDKKLISFDEKNFNIVINLASSGPITANESGIYQIYRQPDYFLKIDSVYFIQIDIFSKQTKQIKRRVNDRYISNLSLKFLTFINNDIIFAVGNDNLIYVSSNKGIDWELKSLLRFSKIFRFSKLESATVAMNAQFFKSNDGGITWLPQRNFHPAFTESLNDLPNFNNPYVFFSSPQNGFALNDNKYENEINIAYTKDGGDSVFPKFNNGLKGYILKTKINSISLGERTILFYPASLQDWNFTLVYYLDKNIETTYRTYIDSTIIFFVEKYKDNEFIGLAWNLKRYDKYFSLIKSVDTAKSWEEIFRFDLKEPEYLDFSFSSIIIASDNILMATNYSINKNLTASNIYHISIGNKTINKIFNRTDNWVVPCFLKSKNKIYYQTYHNDYSDLSHQWFVNNDLENEPTNWIDVSPEDKTPVYFGYNNSDSLMHFIAFDLESRKFSLWFAEPVTQLSVEKKNNYIDYVFIDNPIPNPSNIKVKLKIWWDASFNIEKDFIKIFDLYGNNHSEFCKVNLEVISPYSGEITIHTEQLRTGLYFVSLNIGGNYKTKPFFIIK